MADFPISEAIAERMTQRIRATYKMLGKEIAYLQKHQRTGNFRDSQRDKENLQYLQNQRRRLKEKFAYVLEGGTYKLPTKATQP